MISQCQAKVLECKILRVYDSKTKNIHEELVFNLRYFLILPRSQIIKSYSKKLIEYLNRQSHSEERERVWSILLILDNVLSISCVER